MVGHAHTGDHFEILGGHTQRVERVCYGRMVGSSGGRRNGVPAGGANQVFAQRREVVWGGEIVPAEEGRTAVVHRQTRTRGVGGKSGWVRIDIGGCWRITK